MTSNLIHSRLVNSVLLTTLSVSAPVFAFTNVCDSALISKSISLSYAQTEQSRLQSAVPAQLAINTEQISAAWHINTQEMNPIQLGLDMQYTIMDFDAITPMTNGHLHTWNFPITWEHADTQSKLFFSLTPALSVSSNALRNPELIDVDGLQLKSALIYSQQYSATSSWVTGFRSDYSFGRYLLYPLVGLCWQPAHDWQLQLALPDFSIKKYFSNKFSMRLFAGPHGNQWHVYSKDTTRSSDFIYNAVSAGLAVQWRPVASISVELQITRELARELLLTLDSDQLIKTEVDASTRLALSAQVLF